MGYALLHHRLVVLLEKVCNENLVRRQKFLERRESVCCDVELLVLHVPKKLVKQRLWQCGCECKCGCKIV
jgi:hypothetical protein